MSIVSPSRLRLREDHHATNTHKLLDKLIVAVSQTSGSKIASVNMSPAHVSDAAKKRPGKYLSFSQTNAPIKNAPAAAIKSHNLVLPFAHNSENVSHVVSRQPSPVHKGRAVRTVFTRTHGTPGPSAALMKSQVIRPGPIVGFNAVNGVRAGNIQNQTEEKRRCDACYQVDEDEDDFFNECKVAISRQRAKRRGGSSNLRAPQYVSRDIRTKDLLL